MKFTAEDLASLKTVVNSVHGLDLGATVTSEEILALIYRLECTENVAKRMLNTAAARYDPEKGEIEAWLQSKGEAGEK